MQFSNTEVLAQTTCGSSRSNRRMQEQFEVLHCLHSEASFSHLSEWQQSQTQEQLEGF